MKNLFRLKQIVAMVVFIPAFAFAQPFSELIVLSGSLTDNGNFASVNGDFPPPFNPKRVTNDLNIVDYFAQRMNLSADPSLHLIGPPQGTNYAVLGALAGGFDATSLRGQLSAYLLTVNQHADPEAFYFVFNGGNDVIAATFEPDYETAKAMVVAAVDGHEDVLRGLVAAGAKTILVGNFVDFGVTPIVRQLNLSDRATEMTLLFNKLVTKLLRRLEHKLDFNFITFDFYQFSEDILANYEKLGFTNKDDSCVALIPSGECDLNQFIFFNETFPSSKLHELLGTQAYFSVMAQLNRPLCKAFGKKTCKKETRDDDHSRGNNDD